MSLVLVLVAVSASAQSRAINTQMMQSEKRVALVIGNAGYAAPADLKNPVNDANDMAATLRSLGFDVILRTDADLRTMQAAAREFAARLGPIGVGLFYYAGHGVQVRGNNYLIPIGAKLSTEAEVEDEAMDVNRVLKVMDDSRSRVNIVVLDACRDNPFSRNFRSATRGLAMMPAPSGTIVAYATGPGAVAADGTGRNGLFTGELLPVIRTPGLDIIDVFRQVVGSVRDRTNGRQVPWTLSSLDGYFYFALPTASQSSAISGPVPARPDSLVDERKRLDDERRRLDEARQRPAEQNSVVAGIPRFGIVDVTTAIAKWATGVSTRQGIEKDRDFYQAKIDLRRRELEELRDELEKRGALMTAETRREKQDLFEGKRSNFSRLEQDLQRDLEVREQALVKHVLAAVKEFGVEQNYDAIVEKGSNKTIYARTSTTVIGTTQRIDVTSDIIRRLDARKFTPW